MLCLLLLFLSMFFSVELLLILCLDRLLVM